MVRRFGFLVAAVACQPINPSSVQDSGDPTSETATPSTPGTGTVEAGMLGLPARTDSLSLAVNLLVDGELVDSGTYNVIAFDFADVPAGEVEVAVVDGSWFQESSTSTGGSGFSGNQGLYDSEGYDCHGSATGTLAAGQVLALEVTVGCFTITD